ncbi:MAG: hypothetical protein ACOCRK_03500 [bacterium]
MIILNTENCYEGFNKKEEFVMFNNYCSLYNDENVDNNTIKWSNFAWEDEKHYFLEFITQEIKKYETKYKTCVLGVGLIGKIGLWNGKHFGGRIIDIENLEDELLSMEVDAISAEIEEDGLLAIKAYHHDGMHYFNLHFITENKLTRCSLLEEYYISSFHNFDIEDLVLLSKNSSPIKIAKSNKYYN